MATSTHFNNHRSFAEQTLIEDLAIESIKIYGIDCWYLPRRIGNLDPLYTEDTLSHFDRAYSFEMYVKNVDGFTGQGDFLSKFGLEIRDEMTLVFARRVFDNEVKRWEPNIIRPNEGDLIFFPISGEFHQVKFVEHESIFYQLGSLQVWEVIVEQFEYSGEAFNTGVPELDSVVQKYKDRLLVDGDDTTFVPDDVPGHQQNIAIQDQAESVLDFTETDPFSESGIY